MFPHHRLSRLALRVAADDAKGTLASKAGVDGTGGSPASTTTGGSPGHGWGVCASLVLGVI